MVSDRLESSLWTLTQRSSRWEAEVPESSDTLRLRACAHALRIACRGTGERIRGRIFGRKTGRQMKRDRLWRA